MLERCVLTITGLHDVYAFMRKGRLKADTLSDSEWRSFFLRIHRFIPKADADPLSKAKQLGTEYAGKSWDDLPEVDRLAAVCAYALSVDSPGMPAWAARAAIENGGLVHLAQAVLRLIVKEWYD